MTKILTNEPRTALITGGTRGIGLEVAIGLAKAGYRVVITGRDSVTGIAAAAKITASASASEGGEAIYLPVDLADPDQIRELSTVVGRYCSSLELLIHNAALVANTPNPVACGVDEAFAVNHLAVYQLTFELMELLARAERSRIVITASQVEAGAKLDPHVLGRENSYSKNAAYARSKLANVLFTFELARRLEGSMITANCLHPGVVRTSLLDALITSEAAVEASLMRGLALQLRQLAGSVLRRARLRSPVQDWAITAEAGAQTTLYVALSSDLDGVSGVYFKDCAPAESSPQSHDADLSRALWTRSAELVGISEDWPQL